VHCVYGHCNKNVCVCYWDKTSKLLHKTDKSPTTCECSHAMKLTTTSVGQFKRNATVMLLRQFSSTFPLVVYYCIIRKKISHEDRCNITILPIIMTSNYGTSK
jgi:hypothetical protein